MNSTQASTPLWPAPLGEAAFHGLAGEIVRTSEPHTEGDPAALLLQILVALGNVMGAAPISAPKLIDTR
jgi:hypothetical protein